MVWIYSAFLTLGLLLGFLIGGSETPVVNVAIPALAGIVTAILAATVNRGSTQDLMKLLETVQAKETSVQESIQYIARQTRQAAQQIGIATLLFCVGYASGITLGSWVRLSGTWARAFAQLEAPWLGQETPLDFKARADWLVYQQKLQVAGAPKKQIDDMFTAYQTAHTIKSRKPVKPWLTQENTDLPSFKAIIEWLSLEPSLAIAGLNDEQIGNLWPKFIASTKQVVSTKTPTQQRKKPNNTPVQAEFWISPYQRTVIEGIDPCLLALTITCPTISETPFPSPQSPLLLPENLESVDPSQLDRYYSAPSKVP